MSQKVSILFWNILYPYGPEKTVGSQSSRLDQIIKSISSININFDYICLAEVENNKDNNNAEIIAKKLKKTILVQTFHSRENESICIIGSVNDGHKIIDQPSGKIIKKAVEINHNKLKVCATHLTKGAFRTSQRLDQISKLIKKSDSGTPVIICGDFNESPKKLSRKLLVKNGYSSLLNKTDYIKTTPRGTAVNAWKYAIMPMGISVDDIYYKNLNLIKYGTIKGPSDHLALWAQFEY